MTKPTTNCQLWAALRRRGALTLCLILCTLGLGISVSAKGPTIITFDAPVPNSRGINIFSNNALGAIIGLYYDENFAQHGFLRTPNGTFTAIDVPGAGTGFLQGTAPVGLSDLGVVTGNYWDLNGVSHGFIRTPGGAFTTVDPTGSTGTNVTGINLAGAIGGNYNDASGVSHGFLRTPDGRLTTFDAPGAIAANGGTGVAGGLTLLGSISGYYGDADNVVEGFVRSPSSKFITIVDPTAGTVSGAGQGTQPIFISPIGALTGVYVDSSGTLHGFLRTVEGEFTTVDPPGTGFTAPQGINLFGAIVGYYFGPSGEQGFLRTPDGTYTTITPPGAGATIPSAINVAGEIVGTYFDSNGGHGFLYIP